MFVVRSGRLEVVREMPGQASGEIVRVLREGAAIGELALLTGAPRSASVRARREAELWELDAEHFGDLLRHDPSVSIALTRALARLLQGEHAPARPSPARPRGVLAVTPLQKGLPTADVFDRLTHSLRRLLGADRVLVLDDDAAVRHAE